MKGFEDVKISWKGVEYTIPANRMLMAVAEIEDAVRGDSSRPAIQILTQKPGPTYSRIAMGYAAALKAAGAPVSGDEVYLSIMEGFADQSADTAVMVQGAIFSLLAIMSPPIALALRGDGDTEKKPQAAG